MRVTATFSKGMARVLDGMAIGDEFEISAHARVVGADESLLDVTAAGADDTEVISGELEVRLLLSKPILKETHKR